MSKQCENVLNYSGNNNRKLLFLLVDKLPMMMVCEWNPVQCSALIIIVVTMGTHAYYYGDRQYSSYQVQRKSISPEVSSI